MRKKAEPVACLADERRRVAYVKVNEIGVTIERRLDDGGKE